MRYIAATGAFWGVDNFSMAIVSKFNIFRNSVKGLFFRGYCTKKLNLQTLIHNLMLLALVLSQNLQLAEVLHVRNCKSVVTHGHLG
jgi:hypothetical protein